MLFILNFVFFLFFLNDADHFVCGKLHVLMTNLIKMLKFYSQIFYSFYFYELVQVNVEWMSVWA